MSVHAPVIYSTDDESYLCFNHAVKRALEGVDVEAYADDSKDSEYNMGPSSCVACMDGTTIKLVDDVGVYVDDLKDSEDNMGTSSCVAGRSGHIKEREQRKGGKKHVIHYSPNVLCPHCESDSKASVDIGGECPMEGTCVRCHYCEGYYWIHESQTSSFYSLSATEKEYRDN